MSIYTSYFGNYRNFPKGAIIVSIAQKSPKGQEAQIIAFAPREDILWAYKQKQIDEYIYKTKYLEQLENIPRDKVEKIARTLQDIETQCDNVILCCYEKRGDFCHRHILRDWLNAQGLNLNIKELE